MVPNSDQVMTEPRRVTNSIDPADHLILIVEDNRLIRETMRDKLKASNFLVQTAENVADARQTLRYQSVDLVILDIIVPDMDGLEFLSELRRNYSPTELPIIMVTVKDQSKDIVQALDLGANDYVPKPVDQEVLEARIRTQLTIKELHEENRKLARFDDLTGLLDRRVLLDKIDTSIEECEDFGQSLSLALIDLDKFKDINDNYGHQVGDEVLEMVGSMIRDFCESNEFTGRYGGEEFAVVFPGLELAEAKERADNLRIEIESRTFHIRDTDELLDFTCSVGVGSFCEGEFDDRHKLVQMADEALFEAKQSGRNITVACDA